MRFAGVLVTCLVAVVGAGLGGVGLVSTAAASVASAPVTCARFGDADAPTEAESRFPSGMAITSLASVPTDDAPAPPLRMRLALLELPPGSGVPPRLATGPMVYVVASGDVVFRLRGREAEPGPPHPFIVRERDLYSFENVTGEPARVIRLTLDPEANSAGQIMVMPTAPVEEAEPLQPPVVTVLVNQPIELPSAGSRLYLACLEWEQRDAVASLASRPGAVWAWVAAGDLEVDGQRVVNHGPHVVLADGLGARLAPGAEPPVVLLVGVLTDGAIVWEDDEAG